MFWIWLNNYLLSAWPTYLVLHVNYLQSTHIHINFSQRGICGSDLLTLRDSCLFGLELNMMHNLWETNGVQTERRRTYRGVKEHKLIQIHTSTVQSRFSDNLWFSDYLFFKDQFITSYYIKSFDFVTISEEAKSVTKSRLHCSFGYSNIFDHEPLKCAVLVEIFTFYETRTNSRAISHSFLTPHSYSSLLHFSSIF